MGSLTNVKVTPKGGNAPILSNGTGTLARDIITVTGNWNTPPNVNSEYTIVADEQQPGNAKCTDYQVSVDRRSGNQISEGTFKIA